MIYISAIGLSGLFSLPFLLPIHTAPIPSFHAEWFAAILALIGLLVYAHRNNNNIEIPKQIMLIGALMTLMLAQYGFKEVVYPSQYVMMGWYLMGVAVTMMAGRSLATVLGYEKIILILCWSVLLGGLANAVIAIMQYWGLESPFNNYILPKITSNVYGNIAQPNQLATQLVMAWVALVYMFSTGRLGTIGVVALGALLMLSITLSGSRSVVIFISGVFLLSAYYRYKHRGPTASRLLVLSLLAIVMFFVFQKIVALLPEGSQVPVISDEGYATALTRLQDPRPTLGVRQTLWLNAWGMFLENPMEGVGLGNYSWHFFQIASVAQLSDIYWLAYTHYWSNCHNLPLQLLAEFGMFAGVILIVFGYWLLRSVVKANTPESWFVLAMLGIILMHSLVEYPLYYTYFLFPFSVLLSLVRDGVWSIRISVLPRQFIVAAVIVLAGVQLLGIYKDYTIIESIHSDMQRHPGRIADGQLIDLGRMQNNSLLAHQAEQLLNSMGVSLNQPDAWGLLLGISTRVVHNSTAAPYLFRHILLLGLNGKLEEARQLIPRVRHIYPAKYEVFKRRVEGLGHSVPAGHPINNLMQIL